MLKRWWGREWDKQLRKWMDAASVCFSVFACEMYLSALVSEELASIVDDLLIREGGIRLLLTNAQHLPQSDSERPHIARRGELTL